MSVNWHSLSQPEVAGVLEADAARGLTRAEAAARLARHGPNELVERGAKSPWRILWEQSTAVMVLILIGAAFLSLGLGKLLEAGAILAIVVLFGLLGFLQEHRAERAIAELRKLAVPRVRVLRDGALAEMSARELVPGDVVTLEAGNLVPADVRLIDVAQLRVQEAALTGESEPVEKATVALADPELPLGDRINMGYMGTLVTYGRGQALALTEWLLALGAGLALLLTTEAEKWWLRRQPAA